MEMAPSVLFPCLLTAGILHLIMASVQPIQPLEFTTAFPTTVEFSNSSGGRIECSARGDPQPLISWRFSDGSSVNNVPGLRHMISDGTLVFPPFKADDYRQDVHSVSYRCSASNAKGSIITNEIHIKGVVLQVFDLHVYDVFAMKQNPAVIKCHIPEIIIKYVKVTSWVKDSIAKISWTKYDASSKYFILPNGNLLIQNVTLSDGMSSFRCLATNQLTGETKTSVSAGKLIVTEPKQPVPPKIAPTSMLYKVDEGQEFMLPCVVQGNPFPEISWSKQIADGRSVRVNNSKRTHYIPDSLIITKATHSDSGVFTCTATNTIGSEKVSQEVIVTVPLKVKVHPATASIDFGQSVSLECIAEGIPIRNVAWLKDGLPLPSDGILQPNNKTVHIIKMTSSLAGFYQCFASNEFHSSFGNSFIQLGDSHPEIFDSFEEKILHPGEMVTLICKARGTPKPEMEWRLDETEIATKGNIEERTYLDDSNNIISELLVHNIRTDDGGVFKCIAKNKAGKAIHKARIHVYGKLSVRSNIKVFATAEEATEIDCPYYGYPVKSISWTKDDVMLPQNKHQFPLENGTLFIEDLQRKKDSGMYECHVEGPDGSKASGEIEVVIMVRPKITPFSFQEEQIREGNRARIHCVISEGESPLTITWLKDGSPPSSDLGLTIRHLDEFSSVLLINAIAPRHNGNYTCIASNKAGQAVHTAPLFVNVIPRIIPFKFRSNVLEGNPVRITCVVDQGDLPINLQWMKDKLSVSDIKGISSRRIDDYSSLLTIDNVNVMHSGNYTCVAKNAAASVSYTTSLVVNVPPKVVPFSFQDDHLLEGMLVRVSCVVSRGDLPLEITWLKDDKTIPLELSINTRHFDEYSSVLSIDPVTVNHSGSYTCIAKNHAGIASHSAKLNVNVPPEWVTTPSDVEVNIGYPVLLHCQATGYPQPTIAWEKRSEITGSKRNFIKLSSNNKMKIFPNGTLSVFSIEKTDEGTYFCIASNDIGRPLSVAVNIKVNAAPVFKTKHEEILAKKGDTVTISCKAEGDGPMIYKWNVNNSNLDSWFNSHRYKLSESFQPYSKLPSSDLIINYIDKKDSVTYICSAENSIGIDEKYFKLTVQNFPDAPEIRTPIHVFNQSIEISWNVPFNGNSEILRYFIEYRKDNDRWNDGIILVEEAGRKTSKIVSNLIPASLYVFRIKAENAIGNGTYSKEMKVKTEEIAPTGSPQNVQVESTEATVLRVTWNPPKKMERNGAIQGYNIGYRINGFSSDYRFFQLEVPEDYTEALIYQLTNLQMYTQYEVIVQAYNSKGSGPSSEPVVAMTSEGVPSEPPRNVRCSTLSSQSIYILWDPPLPDTLNGILRGYKVLYKPSNEWYDALQQFKITQSSKMSLQELEINTNYSFQVLAFTKVGDGKRSELIHCKTFEDVPEAPTALKVLPSSSDSVVVSWKPSKKMNTAINQYNVYYKPLDDGQEVNMETQKTEQFLKDAALQQSHSDSPFLEVKGLKKNRKYLFWVTASSSLGESPTSSLVAETVADSVVPAKIASFDDIIKTPWKRDVIMPCKAIGVPIPNTKWTVGSQPLSENGHLIFRPDGALMISKATSEDSGNYTCAVYNEYGRDEITYSIVVQVPPSAPKLDIISKSKSSIQLQWKAGPHGGDPIRGYLLHHKKGSDNWSTIEIRPEHRIYTLDNLPCGTSYQLYMEAFNSVGTSTPSETITGETGGAEETASKEKLIKESSTFVSVHLDSWPTTGCPVEFFGVEYKATSSKEWTVVGNSIPPSQKRVTISDLKPATWYLLRLLIQTTGGATMHEYKFSTLSITGDIIPPEVFEDVQPIYIFHLDPWIFIPAVILLIVVIIASVIVCIVVKRRNGTVGAPSEMDLSLTTNQMNTWIRSSRTYSTDYGYSQRHSTLSSSKDPCPYATSRMTDCYPDGIPSSSVNVPFLQPGSSQTWKHKKSIPLSGMRNDFSHKSEPDCAGISKLEETSLVFLPELEQRLSLTGNNAKAERPDDDYDPPPKAHMISSFPSETQEQFEDGIQLMKN